MRSSLLVVITKNIEASEKAVRQAIQLAKEKGESKLLLMYMHPLSQEQEEGTERSFQKQLIDLSEEVFEACSPLIDGTGLLFDKYVGVGNLLHEIRIQIQLGRCGLLVMATEQLAELVDTQLNLEEKLTCPVLLV